MIMIIIKNLSQRQTSTTAHIALYARAARPDSHDDIDEDDDDAHDDDVRAEDAHDDFVSDFVFEPWKARSIQRKALFAKEGWQCFAPVFVFVFVFVFLFVFAFR